MATRLTYFPAGLRYTALIVLIFCLFPRVGHTDPNSFEYLPPEMQEGVLIQLARQDVPALLKAHSSSQTLKSLINGNKKFQTQILDYARSKGLYQLMAEFPGPNLPLAERGNYPSISSVKFSPDGKFLAAAVQRGGVHIWDLASKEFQLITELSTSGHALELAFSPGGNYLVVTSSDGATQVWDATSFPFQLSKTLEGQPSTLARPIAFSPDEKYLVVGSWHGTIQLFEMTSGTFQLVASPTYTTHMVSIHFSPDGKFLISASTGGIVHLWDHPTRPYQLPIPLLEDRFSNLPVAFSHCGNSVVLSRADRTLAIQSVAPGGLPATPLPMAPSQTPTTAAAFSPNGRYVVLGMDDSLVTWDIISNKPRKITKISDHISAISFSQDGNYYAAGSRDGTVQLYALAPLVSKLESEKTQEEANSERPKKRAKLE